MCNYSENIKIESINTYLYMKFSEDISQSFGNELPYPYKHYFNYSKINGKLTNIVYIWLLDGYFNTNANYEYLNDIIARMMITFKSLKVEKVKHYKKKDFYAPNQALKLKTFQNLHSINIKVKNYQSTNSINVIDQVFWALKLFAEDCIKSDNFIIYDQLERFAFQNFIDKTKDKSTLRAKCRSIWNYYNNKNFKCDLIYKRKLTNKELTMSRSEAYKKINKEKAENNYKKIIMTITGLGAAEMFKTKSSNKWNATKIAKYLNMDAQTVRKHLKNYLNSLNEIK